MIKIKYIIMVFAGACSYGFLSTFVKLAYKEGYSPSEISFSQAFIGMIALWLMVLISGKKNGNVTIRAGNWSSFLALLLTGITIGLTTFTYYVSVKYIPASVAIVFLMQFVWIGVFLEWLVFKKKPTPMQLMTVLLIITGTVLASGMLTEFKTDLSLKGIGYALLSSLLYAIYIVGNSRVGKSVAALQKSAIIVTGSAAGIFFFNVQALAGSEHILDPDLGKWALFLALFGTIIPPVLFAKGISQIGAGISAIIMAVELPVAIVCSYLILKEQVSFLQWTGVLLMLLSIVLLNIPATERDKGT